MTRTEKKKTSLKNRINKMQEVIKINAEHLKILKAELEQLEMNELKTVLMQKNMTVEQIIADISRETHIFSEQKIQNRNSISEEKKNVEY